ncbi:zinc ribbon domain-containing protein [Blastococcus brunescens]|uniref:Zinc ribbon domain-containing protein n=1 Tax=Blastococcus brunescens TaxID=1564165 RepID=A0ABZ1B2B8_9ACTN|nr:zinc ribbon domain-containing protein [Blastococcus sp. BMG 8361]WRL64889.1 zinc ribbon domain-containing protein [Blastococcus sp. BMG 8361]
MLLLNRWRRQRGDRPIVGYQELCRELAAAGAGTFGELSTTGARSVLRAYSDAWMSAARRRRAGDMAARFPRRRRALVPVRFYAGTFTVADGRVRLPVARGRPPLWVRPARPLPYPAGQVRSVRLVNDGRRLFLDVTAEIPVATYPPGSGPDPARVAGVDLGIIHPYAVLAPAAARAARGRRRGAAGVGAGVARRAPAAPGRAQGAFSRGRPPRPHPRVVRVAAVEAVPPAHPRPAGPPPKAPRPGAARGRDDGGGLGGASPGRHPGRRRPRGVLARDAGRRQNKAVRDWAVGDLIRTLADKAERAGIAVELVDERGTSSTCPACSARVAKPRGRVFSCRSCRFTGHRDLVGAANIAARATAHPGSGAAGGSVTGGPMPSVTTHRRAGRHLPGAGRSRRDPRRGLISRPPAGRHPPTRRAATTDPPGPPWPAPQPIPVPGSRSPAPAARIRHRSTGRTMPDTALAAGPRASCRARLRRAVIPRGSRPFSVRSAASLVGFSM